MEIERILLMQERVGLRLVAATISPVVQRWLMSREK
jgi:hypothetical protein